MSSLKHYRASIDIVDAQIRDKLRERFDLSREAQRLRAKKTVGGNPYDGKREADIVEGYVTELVPPFRRRDAMGIAFAILDACAE